ncbi:MAG: response regulator [Symbiobacteriia bacterium]
MRLLIADDDPLVREAIKTWVEREFGDLCSWIGLAADGDAALQLAEQEQPNVAVLDIRMPGQDGLIVTRQLKAAVPDMHIVILSAHGEFQYAQQAIHLGVEEYLVKPFSPEQLMDVLRKALQVMQEKVRVQRTRQLTNQRIRGLVVEQLLTSRSRYDKDTLQECAAILGLEHPPNSVLIAEWMPEADLGSDADNTVLAVAQRLLPGCPVHRLSPQRIAVLAQFPASPDGRQRLEAAADQLRRHLKRALGHEAWVGVGGPQVSGEDLSRAHADAMEVLAGPLVRLPDPSAYAEALFAAEGPAHAIEQVQGAIRSRHGVIQADLIRWGFHLLTAYRDRLVRVGGGSVELDALVTTWSRDLPATRDTEQFEEWMGKTLVGLHTFKRNCTRLNTRQIVRAIAAHLDDHYMQDTDLASLALQYDLSVPHLSRLFKKEIGQNFSTYLTAVRLDAARTLLSQGDLSVYAVSKLTGFSSHGYFSSVFKRRFQMSPTDYRVGAAAVEPG